MIKITLGRAGLLSSTALQAAFVLLPLSARAQPAANAQPGGGQVVAGAASIAQSASTTTITQSSQRAAINWQSFNIGAQQSVQFQQPSSSATTLNRVVGPNPSQIAGRIQANGQVIITNQDGVTFYKGAQVNAAGLMVSSAGISTDNFMAGRLVFNQAGNPNAAIVNAGTITIKQAGLAALVAPQVVNSGVITATMGHVILAGAQAATVDLYGDGLVALDVTKQVTQVPVGRNGRKVTALVTNTGTILAPGGSVQLTAQQADGLVQDLVQAGGTIAADSVGGHTGQIVVNGIGGSVIIAGTLSAQGTAAGSTGGRVVVAPSGTVVVGRHGAIDVSGAAGGGTVLLGATSPATPVSAAVLVAPGAQISANATQAGAGGRVVLHPTGLASLAGTVSATGGPQGGNGGSLEVSGSSAGASGLVDLSAPLGAAGTVLFDPATLTIVSGTGTYDSGFNGTILSPASLPPDTVSSTVLQGWTASAIVLQATSLIDVQATVSVSQNLTLQSGGDITVEATGGLTTTGDLVLQAAYDFVTNTVTAGAGGIALLGSAAIGGANVLLAAGTTGISLGSGTVTTGGVLTVSAEGGGVSQDAAGAVSATILQSGTSGVTGTVSLPGTNSIGVLSNVAVTGGDLILNNGTRNLLLTGDIAAGTVNLIAGTVTQSTGTISATTFTGSIAGGGLTDSNAIGTLNGLAVTNNLTLNNGATDLAFAGSNAIGGGLTLIAGSLTQSGGVVVAGTLSGTIAAGSLTGSNAIGTLDGLVVTNNLALNDGTTALALAGSIGIGGGLTLTAGSLTQSGGVVVAGTLSGTIAGGSLTDGNNIGTLDGLTSLAGLTLFDGANTLAFANAVNIGTSTLNLRAGSLSQSAGVITAGTFTGQIAGGISLGGSNAIGALIQLNTQGDIALNDGTAALTVGNIDLQQHSLTIDAGSLNQVANTGINPGTLGGTIAGDISLTGNNQIGTVSGLSSGGNMVLDDTNIGALTLSGPLTVGGTLLQLSAQQLLGAGAVVSAATLAGVIQGNATLTGANTIAALGSLSVQGNLLLNDGTSALAFVGDVDLNSRTLAITAGSLSQSAGSIVAGTLTGSIINGISLGDSNRISNLASLSAGGDIVLNNGSAALGVTGQINLGTYDLSLTAGTVSQSAGAITAGTLTGSIGSGGVTLLGSNDIATIGPLTATGGIVVLDATNLTVAGSVAAPSVFLAVTAAGDTLALGANSITATGGLISLVADAIVSNAAAALSAATVELAPYSAGTELIVGGPGTGLLVTDTLLSSISATTLRLGAATAPAGVSLTEAAGISLPGSIAISAATLDLASSAGVIQPGTGTLSVTTLISSTGVGGDVSLPGSNAIGTLGPFLLTSGNLLLNDPATRLAVSGAVNLNAGAFTLTSAGMTQGSGIITAGTLTGSITGGVSLLGTNAIATLASLTAGGDVILNDGATDLTLVGPIALAGHTLALAANSLSQSGGAVTADTFSGSITAGASLGGANVIGTLANFSAGADSVLDDPGTELVLAGSIAVAGHSLTLDAASLTQTAGGIAVGALSGSIAGSISLAGSNAVAGLANLSAGGDVLLLDGATTLGITGSLSLPGHTLTLDAGALAQSAGTITADTLTGSLAGTVSLLGANAIGTLGALTAGGAVTLDDGTIALALDGVIQATGAPLIFSAASLTQVSGSIVAGTLGGSFTGSVDLPGSNAIGTLGALTAGGDVTLNDPTAALVIAGPLALPGDVLTLTAASLAQASGTITAATLAGSITGGVSLGGSNAIGTLDNFSAGTNLLLADGSTALVIAGSLGAGNAITLTAASLTQSAGTLSATTLSGSITGTVSLLGTEAIGTLDNFTAGGAFALADSLDLNFAGSVGGQALSLIAPSLTQASGTITAGTLGGSIAGSISLLGSNAIGTLDNLAAGGNLTLNDGATGLQVAGMLNAGSYVLSLTAGTLGQGGGTIIAGTLTGSISGAASLAGSNDIGTLDNFSAQGLLLQDGSNGLQIADALNLGSSALALFAGTLGQASGIITAGTLSGSITGAVSLLGSNAIGTLDNFSTGGNLTLNDASNGLQIVGTLNVGTYDLSLTTGTLAQASGSIIAGTLTGNIAGGVDLAGTANLIDAIGPFSVSGAATIADTGALLLQGLVSAGSSLQIGTTGTLTSLGTVTAATVALSGLAIQQTTGTITAGTLAVLTAGTSGVGLDGGVLTAATLLLAATGSLGETSGQTLGIGTLTGSAAAINLTAGSNTIAVLSGLTAAGSLALIESGSLALAGTVSAGATASLSLQTGGPLSLGSATVTAGTLLLTTASGDLTQAISGAVSVGLLTGSIAGSVDLAGTANLIGAIGPFSASGAATIADTGALALQGLVSAGSTLQIATSGTLTSAGTLNAPTIDISGLAIEQIAGSILAGTLAVLTAGTGGIGLTAGVFGAPTLSLAATGTLAEGTGETLQIGTLTGSASAIGLAAGSNTIAALSGLSADGSLALTDSGPLMLSGTVSAGILLSLQTTGSVSLASGAFIDAPITTLSGAGGIQLGAGTVSAGTTLDLLTTAGDLTQSTAGTLEVGTLVGSIAGAVDLAGTANLIGAIGPFSATGAATIADAGALLLQGLVSVGSTLQIGTAGTLTSAGTLNAPTIDLSGLAIEQSAGSILAGTLAVLTGGTGGIGLAGSLLSAPTLSLADTGTLAEGIGETLQVGALTGASGGIALVAGSNTIATIVNLAASGDVAVNNGASPLGIAGTLSLAGHTLGLTAASLTQTSGSITAATLSGSIAGAVSLAGSNDIATLADISAGTNLLLNDAGTALGFAGTVGAGQAIILTAASLTQTAGAIAAGTLSGSIAGSISLAGNNDIGTLDNLAAGANVTLDDGGNGLQVAGALDLGGNALTLTAGTLGQSSGAITAGTLSGSIAGAVSLLGSNDIGTLDNFSAGGNVTLNDGDNGLQIADALTLGSYALTVTSGTLGQSSGAITAGTLSGSIAGAVSLLGNNDIGTLDNLAAGADVTLDDGGNGLQIADALNLGSNALVLTSGTLGQTSGVITAGTLTGSIAGAVSLLGANDIGTLDNLSAGGNLVLNDAGNGLQIADALNVGANALILTAATLGQASGVITAGTVSGSIAGAIALLGGNDIGTLDNLSAGGNLVLNDAGNGLQIADALNVGANALVLTAATLGQTSGAITAGTLSGSIAGAVSLLGDNDIGTLDNVSAGGNLVLNDAGNGLQIADALNVGANALVLTAATLGQASGVITAGTVSGSIAGAIALLGSNDIGTLDNLTAGGNLTLNDAGNGLQVANALNLAANALTLTAGTLGQSSGVITAGTLSGSIAGAISLLGSNDIGTLDNLATGGNLTLNDGSNGLQVAGTLAIGSNALTLTAGTLGQSAGVITAGTLSGAIAGAISLAGNNAIGTLDNLAAGGDLLLDDGGNGLQIADVLSVGSHAIVLTAGVLGQAAGTIIAGTLIGSVAGAISLAGQNAIGTLDNLSAGGNLLLNDAATPLTLAGAVNVGGNAINLTAASLSQPSGSVTAGSLTAGIAGSVALDGNNAIATIGPFAAGGDATIEDTGNLTILGPVSAGATLALSTSGILTINPGPLAAGGILLTAPTIIEANGQIAGASWVSLIAGGGGIALAANTVLSAPLVGITSGGAVTAAGVIQAGTLTGSAGGPASFTGANSIATLAGFTTPAGFTLTDAAPLTLTGLLAASAIDLAAPDLTVLGGIQAVTTLDVTVPGVLDATGPVTAQVLTGSAGIASFTSASNQIGTLNGFNAATLTLDDATNLLLSGVLNATLQVIDTGPYSLTLGPNASIVTGGSARPTGGVTTVPTPALGGGAYYSFGQFLEPASNTVGSPNGGPSILVLTALNGGSINFATNPGLQAPNLWLSLVFDPVGGQLGSGTGQIDVQELDVFYPRGATGSTQLYGTISGTAGLAAAGSAHIAPDATATFKFNNCPISSVNCIVMPVMGIPAGNPLQYLDIDASLLPDDDDPLVLPAVTDKEY